MSDAIEARVLQQFRWWSVSELTTAEERLTPLALATIVSEYLMALLLRRCSMLPCASPNAAVEARPQTAYPRKSKTRVVGIRTRGARTSVGYGSESHVQTAAARPTHKV